MKTLVEYPNAIAHCQRRQLSHAQYNRRLQETVDRLTAAIDRQIAFDPHLCNAEQRKAERLKLLQAADYLAQVDELQQALDKKVELDIELTLLKNQFAVLKLEVQQAIANASDREMSYAP